MNYVVHFCKNKECNNAFIAEDYTKVKDVPPHWRLCPDCCKELGIDYGKQRPWNSYSEKQKAKLEKLKEASRKFQFKKKVTLRVKTKY